jgi:asparagine N-glycosylation enzyme membrane subunit Stt3
MENKILKMKKIIICTMIIIAVGCGNNQNSEVKIEDSCLDTSEQAEDLLVVESSTPPYEATWVKITETENGYVIYDYPSLWDDGETHSPIKIIVTGNQFIHITYSDDAMIYTFNNVESCEDNSYFFKFGNRYRFKWIDKEKHIAQWIVYSGDSRVQTRYYYIDSLYNTFPIVKYEWGNGEEDYED